LIRLLTSCLEKLPSVFEPLSTKDDVSANDAENLGDCGGLLSFDGASCSVGDRGSGPCFACSDDL